MEETQPQRKKIDVLAIFVVVCLLIAIPSLIYLTKLAKSDVKNCLENPFVYGAAKYEKSLHSNVTGIVLVEGKQSLGFNSTYMSGINFENPFVGDRPSLK